MTFVINIAIAALIVTAIICELGHVAETLLMKSSAVRKLSEMLDYWDEE